MLARSTPFLLHGLPRLGHSPLPLNRAAAAPAPELVVPFGDSAHDVAGRLDLVWIWYSQRPTLTQWQRTFANLLRDGAMGLSVGVSAHLFWDALLSSTRRGFYIRGFSGTGSLLWLLLNVSVGIGVPLLIAWSMQTPRPVGSLER